MRMLQTCVRLTEVNSQLSEIHSDACCATVLMHGLMKVLVYVRLQENSFKGCKVQGFREGSSSSRTEVEQTQPYSKCLDKVRRSCDTNGPHCLAAVSFGLGLKF